MVSFGVRQLISKVDKKWILRLTKAVTWIGKQPAVWMWANGVSIHKAGEEYHTKLKAHCSWLLVSCMGIVFKKVITYGGKKMARV